MLFYSISLDDSCISVYSNKFEILYVFCQVICSCFLAKGAGVYVVVGDRSVPTGALPNNSLIISNNATATLRLRFVCRSTSSYSNVGQLLGLDGSEVSTASLFTILSIQVGTLDVQNNDGHPALMSVDQGVYTCRLPDETGEAVDVNIGIYPSGFNSECNKGIPKLARVGCICTYTYVY